MLMSFANRPLEDSLKLEDEIADS